MHFGMGMSTTVKKAELLEILKKNRAAHQQIFEEAVEGYKQEMIKILEARLEEVKAGKKIHHAIHMPVPSNMTGAYNTAIKMLEMNTAEEIELSAGDFACLVEDKWDWMQNFLLSNSRYSQTAQVMSAQVVNEDDSPWED